MSKPSPEFPETCEASGPGASEWVEAKTHYALPADPTRFPTYARYPVLCSPPQGYPPPDSVLPSDGGNRPDIGAQAKSWF